MKIGIIMTCYNHEKYIAEAIESVIQQSYTNRELYIGNDASTDNSTNIINEKVKHHHNIHVYHHLNNKGITENMNFLLSKLSHNVTHIAFLEGDDIYHKDYLQCQTRALIDTQCKIAIGGYTIIDEAGNIKNSNWIKKTLSCTKNILKPGLNKLVLRDLILYENQIKTFGIVLVERELLKSKLPLENANKSDNFLSTDYLLRLKLLPSQTLIYTPNGYIYYRSHAYNTSKDDSKLLQERQIIRNMYNDSEHKNVIDFQSKFKLAIYNLKKNNTYKARSQIIDIVKQNNIGLKFYKICLLKLLIFSLLPVYFRVRISKKIFL